MIEFIEFQYRLFIDKQETVSNDRIRVFIERYLPNIAVERQSTSEIIFGIRRKDARKIGGLIRALDIESSDIGVDSYGLSMTTIEEVFLK